MTTIGQNQNSARKKGCAEAVGTASTPDAATLVTSNLLILAAMNVPFPDVEFPTFSTVLHELAHILDRPVPADLHAIPDPGRIQFEAQVVANALKQEFRPLPVAYHGHEDAFIRIAVHLHHRANAVGVKTIPNLLCAGRRYGLSHAHRYMEALGDEPIESAHLPFSTIGRLPPPSMFIELWQNDVRRYKELHPQSLNGVPS